MTFFWKDTCYHNAFERYISQIRFQITKADGPDVDKIVNILFFLIRQLDFLFEDLDDRLKDADIDLLDDI